MGIAEELHREYMKNFKVWEREAKEERMKSVDWKKVMKKCNPRQVRAIKLFVRYRLYEAAASIAKMDLYDFILLLRELGIKRG